MCGSTQTLIYTHSHMHSTWDRYMHPVRGGFCPRRFCSFASSMSADVDQACPSHAIQVPWLYMRSDIRIQGLPTVSLVSSSIVLVPFGAAYHNTAKTKGLVRARACSIYQLHVGTAVNQQTETRQQPAPAAAWPSPPQPPLRLFVAANIGGEPVPVATPFL